MTFETCAQRGEGTSWLPNSIYSNFQRTNNDIAIKSSTGEHYGLWRWWWSVTYLIIQNVMSLPDKALKRRFFWNQPCQINFHFKCDAGETELFHSNLVRFPNPLAFGSGLGERTPKKQSRAGTLSRPSQLGCEILWGTNKKREWKPSTNSPSIWGSQISKLQRHCLCCLSPKLYNFAYYSSSTDSLMQ